MSTALVAAALLLGTFHGRDASAQDEESAPPAASSTPAPALTEADYFRTIKVIQKRPVTKAHRLELSPFFAYLPNDDFVRGYFPGVNLDYHMNEGVALEGTAAFGIHSDKQLLGQIRNDGVQPAVLDRPSLIASAGLNWAPIYGKLAWKSRRIITYDLFLTTGFGLTNTNLEITKQTGTGGGGSASVTTVKRSASFEGYYIGIGQRYYFRDWAAVRVELRNYAYTQRVDSSYNDRNNLLLSLGFSFLL